MQVFFGSTAVSSESIRAGKVRPLAVTTATRWGGLPDIPTVGEFLPGYEVSATVGIGAPNNTPAEIIDKLNREISAILVEPKPKTRFSELHASILAGSAADFGKLIADDTEKWARVVKFANIKPE